MESKIIEFRKPLPGQSKQDNERLEKKFDNHIIEALDSKNGLSTYLLDCFLWIFTNGLIGQSLKYVANILGLLFVIRLVAISILIILGFNTFLLIKYPELSNILKFRLTLIVVGFILGLI